jgi:hypothetical protein
MTVSNPTPSGHMLQQPPKLHLGSDTSSDHSKPQPKSYISSDFFKDVWHLCKLINTTPAKDSEIELIKKISDDIENKLREVSEDQQGTRIKFIPSEELIEQTLMERKRKHRADKSYQAMQDVLKPLKHEIAEFDSSKEVSSNKKARNSLQGLGNRLKEVTAKAEKLGRNVDLEDTDTEEESIVPSPVTIVNKAKPSMKTTISPVKSTAATTATVPMAKADIKTRQTKSSPITHAREGAAKRRVRTYGLSGADLADNSDENDSDYIPH